ncbi:MAG TPA: AI-2E family transporter [Candidatus Limnocylindria bacterium]|nr:AI-2E family transporter [Candidatus Limnocylindria bacterium]
MSRELLFTAFFFAVFMFLLYQLLQLLAASAGPLLWAAILALTFYPLTTWLTTLFRGQRDLAAAVLVLLVTAGAILPMVWLGTLLVREAGQAYERVQAMVSSGELQQILADLRNSWPGRLWTRATAPFAGRIEIDPGTLAVGATRWISQQLAGQTAALARNALLTLVNFILMLAALFFFFRDGERMAGAVRDLLPMPVQHKEQIFQRMYATLTAVVQSMLLNAVTQGVLAGLGFWLIGGLTLSVLLGFLTAVTALIPLAGATAVWGPCAIYLFAIGETGRAIGLVLWGFLVVSMVDNVIRPLFIGGRARLPTFLLLFAIIGGLQVYGFIGVFLAPVLVALVLSFVQIYRELYALGGPTIVTESE